MERCATCRYWSEPARWAANLIVPGGRVCTVNSSRFIVIALRAEVGPLLQTEPDFGCVEHRPRLAVAE